MLGKQLSRLIFKDPDLVRLQEGLVNAVNAILRVPILDGQLVDVPFVGSLYAVEHALRRPVVGAILVGNVGVEAGLPMHIDEARFRQLWPTNKWQPDKFFYFQLVGVSVADNPTLTFWVF